MRYLFTILLSVSVLCNSLSAVEYGRLTTTGSETVSDSVVLNEGDVFEIIHWGGSSGVLNHIIDETTGAFFSYNYEDLSLDLVNIPGANIQSERIIVGPGRIFLVHPLVNDNGNYYCGYKLTRRSEIDNKSTTILSIPSESVSSGSMSLIVEGSSDLGSWDVLYTSQLSGSTQAFFRTTIKTIVE